MRTSRTVAALMAALLVTAVGCSKQVTGTAIQDPTQPPLALSDDGSGVVAGYPDAPVQIELYTEPQCTHCAELQDAYGDEMGRYINLGRLAVDLPPADLSGRAGGKWAFGAGGQRVVPRRRAAGGEHEEPDTASGPEFQRFVEELWANQDPGGPGPTDEEMAAMATEAGLPDDVAGTIGDGQAAADVDIEEAAAYNFGSLIGVDPIASRTPTVYDLGNEEKVDIYDNDWLGKLMSSD